MIWSWWVLVFIPVAWLLQNVIHEVSHLLIGWVTQGLKPRGLWPYPHFHDGKFYFARCSYDAALTPDPPHLLRHMSPFLFAGTLLVGLALLFALLPSSRLWLLPFMVTNLTDSLWFWRGWLWGRPSCDGKRFRYGESGIPC